MPPKMLCATETVLWSEISSFKLSNFAGWKNSLEFQWCWYNSIPLYSTQLPILKYCRFPVYKTETLNFLRKSMLPEMGHNWLFQKGILTGILIVTFKKLKLFCAGHKSCLKSKQQQKFQLEFLLRMSWKSSWFHQFRSAQ